MFEYKTFAYLDVPKTASTFISSMLRKFCSEDMVGERRHAGPPMTFDRSKLYFISVRDPLDQYISLYSYGCEGKGQVFDRLERQGQGGLYDGSWSGFERWLTCVLDPSNAGVFGVGYNKVAKKVGYQSYLAVRLAIPAFNAALRTCRTKKRLKQMYKRKNVINYVVRYENLHDDLCDLVTNRLAYCMRVPEAVDYIRNTRPINPSERIDRDMKDPKLGAEAAKLLEEREWLLKRIIASAAKRSGKTGTSGDSRAIPVPLPSASRDVQHSCM